MLIQFNPSDRFRILIRASLARLLNGRVVATVSYTYISFPLERGIAVVLALSDHRVHGGRRLFLVLHYNVL